MEITEIISKEQIEKLQEFSKLMTDVTEKLNNLYGIQGNKEPERLVKFWDIVEEVKSEYPEITTVVRTEKQKNYANKVMAISRLMILADYYNEGWQPDWKSPSWKYFAVYNKEKDQIQIGLSVYSSHGYVYFKSKELLQTAIENNREIFEAALK